MCVQRINDLGEFQWEENGIIINYGKQLPMFPDICYDSYGGAIITWEDTDYGHKIYTQRVNSSGDLQWDEKGVLLYIDHYVATPLGISYILFMVIGVLLLIIVVQRKLSYKNK